MDIIPAVFFRWLHVFTACALVGGILFLRVLVPLGLGALDPVPQQAVYDRFRRAFKFLVHAAVLLLLVSGGYNAWRNWGWYSHAAARPWGHMYFGLHMLAGLILFVLALLLTAGRQTPRWHRGGWTVGVLLAVLVVAAGGAAKWARERAMTTPPAPVAASPETPS